MLIWILIATGVSIVYWRASSDPSVVLRVLTSVHAWMLPGTMLCHRLGLYLSPEAPEAHNTVSRLAIGALGLFVVAVAFTLIKFRGTKAVHLLLLLEVPIELFIFALLTAPAGP